jgi:hypothetical protein
MRRYTTIVTEHQRTHRQWKILCHTCEGKTLIPLFTTSFFVSLTSSSILVIGVVGFHCNWSHSMTQARTRTHPLWLLKTSEQPESETSTWEHTIRETYMHPGIRTRNDRTPATAEPCLTLSGHWDQNLWQFVTYICSGMKASERCWWRLNYSDKRFDIDW